MKPGIGKEYLDFTYKSPLQPTRKQFSVYDVVLYHGPYEFAGIIRHRENVVGGLKRRFQHEGYFVKCEPWRQYNRVGVEIHGNIVFVCKASNLYYDGNGHDHCSHLAFQIGQEVLHMNELYNDIKYFVGQSPHDFFSQSFGF